MLEIETIKRWQQDGYDLRAFTAPDTCQSTPWKEDTDSVMFKGSVIREEYSPYAKPTKAPHERIIAHDRDNYWIVDTHAVAELVEMWGVTRGEGETYRQAVQRRVEATIARWQAWLTDEWRYVGVLVEASRHGIVLGRSYLWGLESDDEEHIKNMADEVAREAVMLATEMIAKLTEPVTTVPHV